MARLNSYGYFIATYLLLGLMGSVSGLMIPAFIGIIAFTAGLSINYLLSPPSEKGSGIKAEDLCGCRLRV